MSPRVHCPLAAALAALLLSLLLAACGGVPLQGTQAMVYVVEDNLRDDRHSGTFFVLPLDGGCLPGNGNDGWQLAVNGAKQGFLRAATDLDKLPSAAGAVKAECARSLSYTPDAGVDGNATFTLSDGTTTWEVLVPELFSPRQLTHFVGGQPPSEDSGRIIIPGGATLTATWSPASMRAQADWFTDLPADLKNDPCTKSVLKGTMFGSVTVDGPTFSLVINPSSSWCRAAPLDAELALFALPPAPTTCRGPVRCDVSQVNRFLYQPAGTRSLRLVRWGP